MAIIPRVLVERQQAANAATTYYTALNVTTVIDKFTATNTSGGAVTLSVFLVSATTGAADANCVLKNKSIASNETYNCPELVGQTLANGDFISITAGAANAITLSVSGREVS